MSDETFFSFMIGNCHTFLNLSGSSKDPGLCFKRERMEKKSQHELILSNSQSPGESEPAGDFFK